MNVCQATDREDELSRMVRKSLKDCTVKLDIIIVKSAERQIDFGAFRVKYSPGKVGLRSGGRKNGGRRNENCRQYKAYPVETRVRYRRC